VIVGCGNTVLGFFFFFFFGLVNDEFQFLVLGIKRKMSPLVLKSFPGRMRCGRNFALFIKAFEPRSATFAENLLCKCVVLVEHLDT